MTYWQDRWAKAQNRISEKNRKQIDKQLRKYYSDAMKTILGDFEATFNKYLYQVSQGAEPTPALLYKLDTYWQLQSQLRRELQKLGEKQVSLLSKQFEINYFDVYYSIAIPGSEAFSTLDVAAVQQIINHIWVADGKSWSQRIWENTEKLAETLNEGLVHCVATGKPSGFLKKIVRERFGVSYSRADALVRTELAHVQTQAAQQRYQDAGVTEVEVWADKDERRCEICGKLHKKRYSINGPMPIPVHPNCRCCVLPVIK